MPSTRVVDVLAEVFRTYGFDTTTDAHMDGQSGTEHLVHLLAEKDGLEAAITVHQDPRPIGMDLVDAHDRAVRDIGARYGVLASIGSFTESAYAHAARTRMILWDQHDLEAVIGKAVLHEVIGDPESDLPIAEVLAHGRHTDSADDVPSVADSFDSYAPETPEPAQAVADEPTGLFAFDPMALQDDDSDAVPVNGTDEPSRTPIIDATVPEPAAAPTRGTIIDAEEYATPARQAYTPTPVASAPRDLVQGRGWVLETSNRREAPAGAVDATNDPDPIPVQPRTKPSIASIAALGGIGRVPRSNGPDPRVFNPSEGALLAPAVSKEQAASAVRDKIYTIDHTSLRYHPKRVYRWAVEAFVEGQVTTTTLSGVRVVDMATRHVASPDQWTASRSLREGTFDIPVDHKPVRIEEAKARALALDSVLDATARDIVVEDHDSSLDIMVTEKKRVRTHRDDVQIHDEGLQWCPVWCFSGVNGEIEVDALTGQIVQERLEARTSNTILL